MVLLLEPTGPWSRMTRFSVPYCCAADLKTFTSFISGTSRPKIASRPPKRSSPKKW